MMLHLPHSQPAHTSKSPSRYAIPGIRYLPQLVAVLDENCKVQCSSKAFLAETNIRINSPFGAFVEDYGTNFEDVVKKIDGDKDIELKIRGKRYQINVVHWREGLLDGFTITLKGMKDTKPFSNLQKLDEVKLARNTFPEAIYTVSLDRKIIPFNYKAFEFLYENFDNFSSMEEPMCIDRFLERFDVWDGDMNERINLDTTNLPELFQHETTVEPRKEFVQLAIKMEILVDKDGVHGALIKALHFNHWEKRKNNLKRDAFRGLCEGLSTLVYTHDPLGQLDYFNSYTREWLGSDVPRDFQNRFLHPDEELPCRTLMIENIHQGNAYTIQHRAQFKDSSYKWLNSVLIPVRDLRTKEIECWIGLSVDIHEQMSSAEKVKNFQNALKVGTQAITYCMFDRELKFIDCVSEHLSQDGRWLPTEYVPPEIVGKNVLGQTWTDVHGWRQEQIDLFEKIFSGGLPWTFFEHELNGKYWRTLFIPYTEAGTSEFGPVTHIAGYLFDHSHLKEQEDKFFQAILDTQTAERSSRMKSEFLAKMSHELRTPLNAIIPMSELLLSAPSNDELKGTIQIIYKASKALMGVIEDILDYTKIEAGKMTLEETVFEMNAVIDSAIAIVKHPLQEKRLEFINHNSLQNEVFLVGDPFRTQQILINILTNAIKFTYKGHVSIYTLMKQICHDSSGSECSEVHFIVSDTGIGISEEAKKNLFKAFEQDSSTVRNYGGSGLGLCISKQLVDLMHGSIDLDSKIGVGTNIKVIVPYKIPIAEVCRINLKQDEQTLRKRATPDIDLSTMKILVVEDNDVNKKIILKLLHKLGFPVADSVKNGVEAICAITKCRNSKYSMYDLVLMDCQMPIMGMPFNTQYAELQDGYDATRTIRQMNTIQTSNLPIIALTANVVHGDREKCLAAGMNDYIAKPINLPVLRETIVKWVLPKKPASDERPTKLMPSFKPTQLDEDSEMKIRSEV
ncbi:Histidine protein kinase 1 [Neolecta irregularis DAH-3]|uniref:Histidine protein kinase 1 n=1 Tax=Neolecta irregularis (strain DAH-3) TaxID=1198029 RepID=A0A1U7LI14_NEOID|nr:Histidine protein kinase 1 [Neolecta irregularis DAH-3]|eukprot:OLL22295.1 Histidine protein kinase 1 [Neolecta irregularis DAH-3]